MHHVRPLEEIQELSTAGYVQSHSPYEQIGGLMKRLEISKDDTTNHL